MFILFPPFPSFLTPKALDSSGALANPQSTSPEGAQAFNPGGKQRPALVPQRLSFVLFGFAPSLLLHLRSFRWFLLASPERTDWSGGAKHTQSGS